MVSVRTRTRLRARAGASGNSYYAGNYSVTICLRCLGRNCDGIAVLRQYSYAYVVSIALSAACTQFFSLAQALACF